MSTVYGIKITWSVVGAPHICVKLTSINALPRFIQFSQNVCFKMLTQKFNSEALINVTEHKMQFFVWPFLKKQASEVIVMATRCTAS